MKVWIAEPRDTLVVRDGRPVQEGSPNMRSLDFPWPSTMAGFVRTRVGTDARGKFELDVSAARRIEVRGPWLAAFARNEHAVKEWLVPAPRDCAFFASDGDTATAHRRRLVPRPLAAGRATDLASDLEIVSLAGADASVLKSKPLPAPSFWRWAAFEDWLTRPDDECNLPRTFGLRGLPHERRTHVTIDPLLGTAADAQLFSTDGLRFGPESATDAAPTERFALAFGCDDVRLAAGPAILGGERRISYLREATAMRWPRFPASFTPTTRRLRIVLLTPGIFDGGYLPTWMAQRGAKVVAAVVPRPQVISGWDFEKRGPKGTRRMVPAGSVYWVDLAGDSDPVSWAREAWMTCIADQEQDRLDGFGLCTVGVA